MKLFISELNSGNDGEFSWKLSNLPDALTIDTLNVNQLLLMPAVQKPQKVTQTLDKPSNSSFALWPVVVGVLLLSTVWYGFRMSVELHR